MDLGALQTQVTTAIEKFERKVGNKDYDEILFLYLSKISEDIGNLSSSVMSAQGLGKGNGEEVGDVFADSLYSIIMLAQKMKIDLPQALQEKIARIEEEGEEAFL